jgi:hypothetical protein
LALATGTGAAVTGASPIRVELTAPNHDPHPRNDPGWHWSFCVRIRTVSGAAVASRTDIRIVSGHTLLKKIATVWLRKGYDHWCQAIGGEDNVLLAVPRGKRLSLQAIVRADGATVTRDWPFVVRG